MAKTAHTKEEPLVSPSPAQRRAIKTARLAQGWQQKDLALKTGLTNATISNVEGGRSVQVKQSVYAKILKALRLEQVKTTKTTPDADVIEEVMDLLGELDSADLVTVRDLAASLANRSTKPA